MRSWVLRFIFMLVIGFMASASYSSNCPQSLPDTNPNFCASFKASAICHCVEMGVPRFACQDMKTLYSRMISMFRSLDRACAYQKDTAAQTCIDEWNCYMNGGEDSTGATCSGSGYACE